MKYVFCKNTGRLNKIGAVSEDCISKENLQNVEILDIYELLEQPERIKKLAEEWPEALYYGLVYIYEQKILQSVKTNLRNTECCDEKEKDE